MSEDVISIPTEVEHTYKVEFRGTSGLFDVGNDTSIEFLQASIDYKKLKHIEAVRSVFKRGTLPFDLLLQRDIDDKRINDDLIPYLLENTNSFFPPIIVVILKINKSSESNKIEEFYPQLTINHDVPIGGSKYYRRQYDDLFTIDILEQNSNLQRWFTELRIGDDARLLAIDGQHRLVALQAILNQLKDGEDHLYPALNDYVIDIEKYKNIKIPVTFLYMPDIYKGNANCHTNIIETFRSVFVDINRNARTVSEIRNILLDEHDFRSIFTRNICAEIQADQQNNFKKYDAISLDEIEWEKESREKQLTNHFAVTNVMIIQNIIADWLGSDRSDNFKQVLKLNILSSNLEDTNISYDEMKLTVFSHKQKKIIVKYFRDQYVEAFINLLSSLPHILKRSAFIKNMKIELTGKVKTGKSILEKKIASKLLKFFFEGEEYKSLLRVDPDKADLKLEYDGYKEQIDSLDTEFTLDFVRTKMFQEGYFRAVFNLFADNQFNIEDFTQFSKKIRQLTTSSDFKVYWKNTITKHIDVLSSGLKNNSGYSASNPLVEQVRKIMWIMLITYFGKQNVLEGKAAIDIKVNKYSDEIKTELVNKFVGKLPDSYTESEKNTAKDSYSLKVSQFIQDLKI